MEKAEILEFVKKYIDGALASQLAVELKTDYGRGYLKSLRSLKEYIDALEKWEYRKKIA